ncbi:hypothetical protein [Nocardia asteroides]|uniref:hypothetical protein n=1 Tax=Nocardia asteroides TaxID=1824 RepID=UPI00364638C4
MRPKNPVPSAVVLFFGHEQRCATGTDRRTLSTCDPQPSQVVFPHAWQVTA